ncbi:hypothetical protein SAMN05421640_0349 [Ekhidna lutea]|uniref:Outer membrane protein beta-barrel domain-containing protein n=1 Tax=Ekhidna lutea TaxID=447679 RepID=A0A239EVM3_EKHLU|nr:hypothetical protein [Ekhidna lutea]SNS48659.1 hypothetical protein SAMN05421640_0349 [Ekhidna lutea]
MKKNITLLFVTLTTYFAFAQDVTQKGSWLLELGTSPFQNNNLKQGGSTGLNLFSSEGITLFSIGADAGCFIEDRAALKFGLGYTKIEDADYITYKTGFKYYTKWNTPIQIDINGSTTGSKVEPLWLGFQLGYAAFLNKNLSFEPTMRYNVSLNEQFSDQGIFELNFNFVIFL